MILIDEKTHKIYIHTKENDPQYQYLAPSVELFEKLAKAYAKVDPDLDGAEYYKAVRDLIVSVDRELLNRHNDFWPVILEQIEAGII